MALLAPGCGLSHWAHNHFKLGPEYRHPPVAAIAEDWLDSNNRQVVSQLPDAPDWWSVFQDPVMNQLIQTAYGQNLSLREAGWRVMQARSQRAIAVGSLFPQSQQGFAEYEHIQESGNVALPAPIRTLNQWSTGLNLSWELDLWGRYRRSIASADANLSATIGDYDAILLCLIAEVATTYADYRTFQQRLEYARQNVKIQNGSLQLTQKKADEGATGFTSVHLAKSSLTATQATIPSLQIGLRQTSNQLCTLLGMPTNDLKEMLSKGNIPAAPPEVAVGIPANLLRRRPDIRAAERAIAAQSEQIGIALSDLYPHFAISGEIAFESEQFGNLLKSASNAGSVGPSLSWNLLNYGRILNNVRLQEAGFQELIASYRSTVLTANQEVEDALVAFLRNQQRVQFLETSVNETEEALKLLTISFNEGQISFTGIFIMQGELAATQDQLAQAQGDIATSLISLYKALGGGWQIRCPGYRPQTLLAVDLGTDTDAEEISAPIHPSQEIKNQDIEALPLPEGT